MNCQEPEAKQKPVVRVRPHAYQPSKAELDEPIHLPGQSPEDVARIVMQGGAQRRESTTDTVEPE